MTLGLIKAILALIALSIAHAILVSGVQAASKESPRKQAARAAAPSRPATIYRCRLDNVTTFSDQPCGGSVQTYDAGLSRLSILDSPGTPARKAERANQPAPPENKAKHSAKEGSQAKQAAACQRAEQSLHRIREQMRAGYSVKQGEQLKARKRDLEMRRREAGC